MSLYVLAYADDWEGMYQDGILVAEGHHIRREEYAAIAGRMPCRAHQMKPEISGFACKRS